MYVSVYLDPPFPLPQNSGKRTVMYIVHMVGQYQKGDKAGSPITLVLTDNPTAQQVTPLLQYSDPTMIDMSQISFEFTSTSPRAKVFVPNPGDKDSPELEIMNFKLYPGIILSATDLANSTIRMNLDGYPLEQRYHSTFIDTRIVFVNTVAFDYISLRDRIVVGLTPQLEGFAGIFEHNPSSSYGSATVYSRIGGQSWERDTTGFVSTLWFSVNQASSDLDKEALSRIRFIIVVY
jgi:hypothetical protein